MTTVTHGIAGAVGVVTLAKPPPNPIDDCMIEDLLDPYRAVLAEGCRAILLRSSMRHFCAGAELKSFGESTFIQHDQKRITEMLDVLEGAPVPTVAAVHGAVLGGGLELALTCDMIVAADTASLGQVEVTVGLLPVLGGTQRLGQRAGLAPGQEIAMLGARATPEAFERWRIINLVVPESAPSLASITWPRQPA